MEIEDSNTLNEVAEEEFLVDPVDIILPTPSIFKPLVNKQKTSVRKKSNNDQQSKERIKKIASTIFGRIDFIKNKILVSKIKKTSSRIWRHVFEDDNLDPFTVIKIRMPSYHDYILRNLYETIQGDQPPDRRNILTSVLHIDQNEPNLEGLINFTVQELENDQTVNNFKSTAETQHIVVILFTAQYSSYERILDGYMKFLSEEFISVNPNSQFFMIFPSLTPQNNLARLDTQVIDLKFAKTRKIAHKLLINLIIEKNFLPILNSQAIVFILHDIDYMNLSFERVIQKLHLLVQDYLYNLDQNPEQLDMIEMCLEGEESSEIEVYHYLEKKRQLADAITVLSSIEENIFGIKGETKGKIIDYLTDDEISYNLPSSFSSKIETLEQALDLCTDISNAIQNTRNDAFKSFVHMFDKLANLEEVSNLKKSKNKDEKRFDALLSKGGKGKAKEATEKEKVNLVKEKIAQNLRLFIKECLLGAFTEIEQNSSNFVYQDTDRLHRLHYTDILEEYCKAFSQINKTQPRKEVPVIFTIIQDFSLRVDTNQSYEAFREAYEKQYKKASKEEVAQAFYVALNELKWLGMVSETRKSQISFEKNFFAKTLFKKQAVDNPEDDEDKN